MTDAQLLFLVVVAIYLSECVVWLRPDAVAVVVPFAGRPLVRRPSAWAGNARGAFAFTTLLPPRAVFLCEPSPHASFSSRKVDRGAEAARAATRSLHGLASAAFVVVLVLAPAASWYFGFERIALLVVGICILLNLAIALAFFRAHRRLDRADRWHRWTHAIVMLLSAPTAIRAVDHVTRHVLRDLDPIAVAARLAGAGDPTVKTMLRELAHPRGAAAPGPRYEAARSAGLHFADEAPSRDGDASAYCPRCLSQFETPAGDCTDCAIALVALRD